MSDNTICIRCGKTRIVAKKWSKYVGTSLITYIDTVCPDPKCQKIVADQLQKKKEKIDAIQQESIKRKEQNRRNKKIRKE